MNYSMVFKTLGKILQIQAFLLFLPLIVSVIYKENTGVFAYAVTIILCLIIGTVMFCTPKQKSTVIYAKEGFVIVALSWICMSALGALPFVISREIPNYIDALFETVSGFTTTGASILDNVETMSHGNLFWRSFTHWIGGMGVLVFIMAIMPNVSDRSIHILRAEVPGPIVGKLVPRIKDTAKILYIIYIALTVLEIVILKILGMSFFESLVHSFGTAGTGGFGIYKDSIASFSGPIKWTIGIFMLLFGVNFNLYYLLLVKKIKTLFKSTELWCYLGIVAISTLIITINISHLYTNFSNTVTDSFFQVSSIMTTTGFSTANFDTWPMLSKTILVLLMMVGGCAGSTAGGLKVARIIILFKTSAKELWKTLHPRSVSVVKFEGKVLEEETASGVVYYFVLYMMCLVSFFLLLSFDPFGNFQTNFTAAMACFNNIGPGLDKVGPVVSYSGYSGFSKVVLSFAMLLGRLEIYPLLLTMSIWTWKKN